MLPCDTRADASDVQRQHRKRLPMGEHLRCAIRRPHPFGLAEAASNKGAARLGCGLGPPRRMDTEEITPWPCPRPKAGCLQPPAPRFATVRGARMRPQTSRVLLHLSQTALNDRTQGGRSDRTQGGRSDRTQGGQSDRGRGGQSDHGVNHDGYALRHLAEGGFRPRSGMTGTRPVECRPRPHGNPVAPFLGITFGFTRRPRSPPGPQAGRPISDSSA